MIKYKIISRKIVQFHLLVSVLDAVDEDEVVVAEDKREGQLLDGCCSSANLSPAFASLSTASFSKSSDFSYSSISSSNSISSWSISEK